MAGAAFTFTLPRAQWRGTLLAGSWVQLLQWPAARRLETVDYPERAGVQEDLHGGLYDGAPRALRLPVHVAYSAPHGEFKGFGARSGGDLFGFADRAAGTLAVPTIGYQCTARCETIGKLVHGGRGAWGQVTFTELELPAFLRAGAAVRRFAPPRGTHAVLLDGMGLGALPGIRMPAGGLDSKRSDYSKLSGAERIRGGGALAAGSVVVPFLMGGGAFAGAEELLVQYGAVWRILVGLDETFTLMLPGGVVYAEARYASQRVLWFDAVRPRIVFEVTFAHRGVDFTK